MKCVHYGEPKKSAPADTVSLQRGCCSITNLKQGDGVLVPMKCGEQPQHRRICDSQKAWLKNGDHAPIKEINDALIGMENILSKLFWSSDVQNLKNSRRKSKGKTDLVDNVIWKY